MSAIERMRGTAPAWKDDPAPEVLIRNRSGSVSSRRPYPVAQNQRFVPPRSRENFVDLISVGEGNDVYLEPEEDVDPLSEEAKNRIKRIKNVGGGAQVLVEQAPLDLDNELRTLKPNEGSLVTVEQEDEEIKIGTNGADGLIDINIDGQIETVAGVVRNLIEGRRGGTSSITFKSCPPASSILYVLQWEKGQILNDADDIEIEVGCDGAGSTETPGP
jgi:hypothetical protein